MTQQKQQKTTLDCTKPKYTCSKMNGPKEAHPPPLPLPASPPTTATDSTVFTTSTIIKAIAPISKTHQKQQVKLLHHHGLQKRLPRNGTGARQ